MRPTVAIRALVLVSAFAAANSSTGGVQLTTEATPLSVSECDALRGAEVSPLPCECRDYTYGNPATRCHPRCCPKDRCHERHALEWSPYEQLVCRPPVTFENFPGDGPCLYSGGNPAGVEAVNQTASPSTLTRVKFTLSQRAEHACVDLMLSACDAGRSELPRDFSLRTSAGVRCPQSCPPSLVDDTCTAASCAYRRGRAHPFLRHWDVPRLVPGSSYLLTCVTIAERETTVDSTIVNETQYLPTAFTVPLDL